MGERGGYIWERGLVGEGSRILGTQGEGLRVREGCWVLSTGRGGDGEGNCIVKCGAGEGRGTPGTRL